MEMSTYHIKSGYTPNTVSITQDDVSGETYWDDRRIQLGSYTFQFPVYHYASTLIRKRNIQSVIDVGCGPATKLDWLNRQNPDVAFRAVDQANVIEYCRKNWSFGDWYVDNFEQPDTSLNIPASDMVICSDVVEHVSNPEVLLSYLKTRVKPDGVILLSTPERERLRGKDCMHSPNQYHIREWSKSEFASFVEAEGFEIIEHFCQLPVKLMFNRITFMELAYCLYKGRTPFYNQVCVVKVAQ